MKSKIVRANSPLFRITLSAAFAFLAAQRMQAEETTVEKAQTTVDEAVKDTKQELRKYKKELRKRTGNESLSEDIKDSAKNAKDEIEFQTKKAKRKID